MYIKNKEQYSEEILEISRHGFIISSLDRLFILDTLIANRSCRVTQLVMETGLSVRQVYYQLSVLRKMDYVITRYDQGRYLVSIGPGYRRGQEMMRKLLSGGGGKEEKTEQAEISHLRIVE